MYFVLFSRSLATFIFIFFLHISFSEFTIFLRPRGKREREKRFQKWILGESFKRIFFVGATAETKKISRFAALWTIFYAKTSFFIAQKNALKRLRGLNTSKWNVLHLNYEEMSVKITLFYDSIHSRRIGTFVQFHFESNFLRLSS